MFYLFSTKAALRKAMVGLSNNSQHYPVPAKTIEAIANYLTGGGISQTEAKIKAKEEIVASLERQSKSLAKQIELHEGVLQHKLDYIVETGNKAEEKMVELAGLQSEIATAQEQLDSLVALIGAAERAATSTEAGVAYHESWDKAIKTGALKDWVEGGSIVSEEEFAGAIEKGMMASFVNNLKGTP